MVKVAKTGLLSELRSQTNYEEFPTREFETIQAAIESVPNGVFEEVESGREAKAFDARIAQRLPAYEFEHAGDVRRNPRCKLWANQGFDHSVDLYNPESRVAIEIEKTERKRVSDDLLKFIKGGKSQKDGRKKIQFGALIVPVNYRGTGDIYGGAMNNLAFMRGILFVDDVAIFGYRDPRWA
jgi:hypothetical protein